MMWDECRDWLRKWIADEVKIDQAAVGDDDPLSDHIDELDLIDLVIAIEEEFGGELKDPAMPPMNGAETMTVRDMVDILHRHVNRQD